MKEKDCLLICWMKYLPFLMVETDNCKDSELGNPRILPIFIPEFGPDRFSDLIASIIINKLVDFTILCAEKYHLPLSKEKEFVEKYKDIDSEEQLIYPI